MVAWSYRGRGPVTLSSNVERKSLQTVTRGPGASDKNRSNIQARLFMSRCVVKCVEK